MFVDIQGVVAMAIAENEKSRVLIDALPDDKLSYKPHPKGRSAAELAWHIITSRKSFLEEHLEVKITDGLKLQLSQPARTKAELLEAIDHVMAEQLEHMRSQDDYWLREEVELFGRNTTLGGVILAMFMHECHHRGQLSAYLRAVGTKVPGVYGDSADDDSGG